MTPTTVSNLADECVDLFFDIEPLWPVVTGIDSTRTGLGDVTADAEARHKAALERLLARARALDVEGLSDADRVTREVIISQARSRLERLDSRLVEFTITDFFVGPASNLLTVLPMVGIADSAQGRAHLERLAAIPTYLEQVAERHREGIAAGRTPVAHLVRAAAEHLDRYLAAPDDDPLRRQEAPDAEFADRRQRLLADVVRPAFARYRDVLRSELLDHGRPQDRPGVCHLPDGDAVYAALARVHTTTDRDPEELHATGLDCIARLAEEYAEVGRRVFGTGDLGEIFARLRTDPALRWNSAEELLDTARAAITRAEREAPKWFGRIPPQPWVVEPVPAAEAPGAAAAYYLQPSVDGTRPGTYFANTHRVTERFRHTAEVTAFHEAIPGHHFQLSTAMNLTDLPLLRRISDVNAYTEGWGLYSERLADEMGLYSDDIARLGMLSTDSMRAGRLVVDTGLHAKGWTRQQAIDFLERNTPMAQVEIVAEVDRYIAYPGQALSYMVGRLEIQRLRSEAEQTLGERFDIRDFHDLVLGGGALPMTVLEDVVRTWVRRRKG
ncbi:DUF885 domain-containing protein [Saccharomonospora glauca]|jgi:uncharacterized protein (DUF885 family)|uniref:DUF885 domain-containing protein n=1 Tax=Saccharomonospora glauca K62 TaxID=928724 RepID=I1D4T6_9PSEU|nr:DUF885 domain-containing protein [Saccharomonospora glauca]EIE99960.1 hypothetical protein SacglDRAFT_03094 [Saccharomonospora glauca K62]